MIDLVLDPDDRTLLPSAAVEDRPHANMQGLAVNPLGACRFYRDDLGAAVVVKVALFHRGVKGI